MIGQDPNGVQISRAHSHAPCMEISERPCAALSGKRAQLPPRLVSVAKILDTAACGDVVFGVSIKIDLR
jgi:hypothetical protein